MILGCLVEHLVFGTAFDYEVSPYKDFKKEEAKLWRKDREYAGFSVITAAVLAKAQQMALNISSEPEFKSWLPAKTNVCLVGYHEPTGLVMKGLIDFAPDNQLTIADLKTSRDASLRGFGGSMAEFGYLIQAGWYKELWRQVFCEDRDFNFAIVESEPPYLPSFQRVRPEHAQMGWEQAVRWLTQYRACLDSGIWPGYPTTLQWAEPSHWYLKQLTK